MTTFSKQAKLDFMHNFRHDTEGDRWAKHEIESLRQQVKLLRDTMHKISLGHGDSTTAIPEKYWEAVKLVREALAATQPKEFT